jgi:hypothetical protein
MTRINGFVKYETASIHTGCGSQNEKNVTSFSTLPKSLKTAF